VQEDTEVWPPKQVLLIGCTPFIVETAAQEFKRLNISVQSCDHVEQHLGRHFDLIVFGGALSVPARNAVMHQLVAHRNHLRFETITSPQIIWRIADLLKSTNPANELVDLNAYCRRIGYNGPLEPDLETLRALLKQHPAAITYENIDILLDRGIDLSPLAVDDKLIHRRRGGYCYEQNALFKRVLTAIGFQVEGLVARVQWTAPAEAPPRRRSHMALRVIMDNGPWLADVGFGSCVPTAPLRLDTTESQSTQHEAFRVLPFQGALAVQARIMDEWKPLYELANDACLDHDYDPLNWFAATHPTSHFRDSLKVARTTPAARYTLLDGKLTIRTPDGHTERRILNATQIGETLEEIFQLSVEEAWAPILQQAADRSAKK
jgi:N-hydroxyarylamine O-acetyltransferase